MTAMGCVDGETSRASFHAVNHDKERSFDNIRSVFDTFRISAGRKVFWCQCDDGMEGGKVGACLFHRQDKSTRAVHWLIVADQTNEWENVMQGALINKTNNEALFSESRSTFDRRNVIGGRTSTASFKFHSVIDAEAPSNSHLGKKTFNLRFSLVHSAKEAQNVIKKSKNKNFRLSLRTIALGERIGMGEKRGKSVCDAARWIFKKRFFSSYFDYTANQIQAETYFISL